MLVVRSCSPITLVEQLSASILAHKRDNPFAPDLVVTPRDAIRRYLMIKLPIMTERAVLNLKVLTIYEYFYKFIRLFNAPSQVSDPDSERFIVRVTLDKAAESLGLRVGKFPEIEGMIHRVLRELYEAGLEESSARAILEHPDEALGSEAATSREFDQLLLLFIMWMRARQQARLYTPLDRLKGLTERLRTAQETDSEGALLHVYGFMQWPQLLDDFFSEVFRHSDVVIYLLGGSGESQPRLESTSKLLDERLQRFHPRIIDPAPKIQPEIKRCCFNASGKGDEVQEAAVRIRSLLDLGVPPSEIGVVARRLDSYIDAIDDVFSRYKIAFCSSARLSPGYDPMVRTIMTCMECLETDFARPAVQDLLRADQINMPESLSPYRYALDLVTRLLGISGGKDWARLGDPSFASREVEIPFKTTDDNQENSEGSDEAATGRSDRTSVPGEIVAQFGVWVTEIRRIGVDWPAHALWSEHAFKLQSFLEAILGSPAGDQSPQQQESRAGIARIVASFSSWDSFEFPVERKVFLSFFKRRLYTFRPKSGGRNGVFVVDADQALGMSFERLFILGLNRRKFPLQIRDNAVISDDFRRKLRAGVLPLLATLEDRRNFERDLFQVLCNSALREITFSYIRSDEEGKPLSPSTFLQELNISGRLDSPIAVSRNTRERLLKWKADYGVAVLPAAELYEYTALIHGLREYIRISCPHCPPAALRFGGAPSRPDLTSQLRLLPDFDEIEHLNEFDSIPFDHPLLKTKVAAMIESKFWATTIETLIGCPYRYYLTTMLGINAIAEPDPWGITPMETGPIVHKILEEVYRQDPELLRIDHLRTIAGEVFAQFEKDHRVGLTGLWRYQRSQIIDYLLQFLYWDRSAKEKDNRRTVSTEEYRFGRIRYSDDISLQLAARIDRIDRTTHTGPEAESLMLDYKSANRPSSKQKIVEFIREGYRLQPAIYLLLMEAGLFGAVEAEQPEEFSGRAGLLYVKDADPYLELKAQEWLHGDDGYSYRTHILRLLRLAIRFIVQGEPLIRPNGICSYCSVVAACRRLDFAARFRRDRHPDRGRELFDLLISTSRTKLPAITETLDHLYREIFYGAQ